MSSGAIIALFFETGSLDVIRCSPKAFDGQELNQNSRNSSRLPGSNSLSEQHPALPRKSYKLAGTYKQRT